MKRRHIDFLQLQGTQFPTDASGNIICTDAVTTSGTPSFAPFVGLFLGIVLVWVLVPTIIAGAMAKSKGESVGLAIGLTLFLGWIGLAIVAFGQRKSQRAASDLLGGASTQLRPDPGDALAGRLRRLDELRDAGVITSDEHASRRWDLLQTI